MAKHPQIEAADKVRVEERELAAQLAEIAAEKETRYQMATPESRRTVFELLRQGFRLPGQIVSTSNGSLQSYQLGRNDCMRELDERIRRHCNDLWILMLDENKPQPKNEQ